jgi:hypothetical protein
MIYWLVFMSVAITLVIINMMPNSNTVVMSFGLKVASICFVAALSTGAFWLLSSLFGL